MQAASWLLVQRAVRDGDMARDDALNDRYRLGSREFCLGVTTDDVTSLPMALADLLTRSDNLYRRIARLDDSLFGGQTLAPAGARGQMDTLAQAFGK